MKPALLLAVACAIATPAVSETFHWAGTTDPNTMDPHAGNSAPVLGFLNNIYEGLVRRGTDMAIEPSLATSWEPIGNGEGWRFILREGVTFHDGSDFNAEDVVFSYQRAASEASDVRSWFASVTDVVAVDDYTVDILTSNPQPIFPDSIANWMMMDSGWTMASSADLPAPGEGNFATLNANGTGPYVLAERQPGLETVLEPFEGWWGEERGNVTRGIFTPIDNSATAVAALLAGDVDMINPVPVQDADRLDGVDGVRLIRGTEARVIMFGFSQDKDTLFGTDDANPFLDVRVRQAVAHAINVPAILQTIMRGSAEPAAQLVGAEMNGFSEGLAMRPGLDLDRARALLTDAGYPDGFSFLLKCPNDRYINDESVCQATVAMLAQIGLDAQLDAIPVSNYWPELREDNYDMYLLGWSPGTFDAEHPFRFLVHTPQDNIGTWNFGGYSNARVDELIPAIQSEIDPVARQAMLDEVAATVQDDVVYVPLYIQPLLWGAADNIELTQRVDNFFILRWVTVE
ncbi:ABC transporter substrate-binding protein [Ponticoccus sp. SC2-23]|uniref:ABC transporter substrate-binding protein n=1 Tax=Alexandriicola marinus TaxID=2081710 RepID=UPI000FD9CDA2|nr:ABC transporter substrate-binding protein [Alexandriicola marinus]MBM1221718.1 ABC transporter substrate-binding protein [Ponticoccus sp. SC6-9]MBM1226069.1 ABC transporter substrate-binding protein [Ponticoccus sp. SC6-15]MBM1230666.1 ABC transporter substrate-binding protein [Ponticoccus sp. SC6-38]MBM1235494.1 ABC transporter substrate-binding protein [Ponticoccus sp. SC6-45]MBM1239687.1 ABC transporter substrate-binding protein [Ponticoccus sp. SC6-49]MBM1243831.1 ABC transporter subst